MPCHVFRVICGKRFYKICIFNPVFSIGVLRVNRDRLDVESRRFMFFGGTLFYKVSLWVEVFNYLEMPSA